MHPQRLPPHHHNDIFGQQRPARYAGSWYPSDPQLLQQTIQELLEKAEQKLAATPCTTTNRLEPSLKKIRAIIVPHAGWSYSAATAAMAYQICKKNYQQITPSQPKPRRIFLLGPSHYFSFAGIGITPHESFQTPLGDIPLDRQTIHALQEHQKKEQPHPEDHSPLISWQPQAHEQDHALEMQLPFIRYLFPETPIIPLLISSLDPKEKLTPYFQLAEQLKNHISHQDLIIISSDFIHYGPRFGYTPFDLSSSFTSFTPKHQEELSRKIEALDLHAYQLIEKGDPQELFEFQCNSASTICGIHAMILLLILFLESAKTASCTCQQDSSFNQLIPQLLERSTSSDQITDKIARADKKSPLMNDPWNSVSYLAIALFQST